MRQNHKQRSVARSECRGVLIKLPKLSVKAEKIELPQFEWARVVKEKKLQLVLGFLGQFTLQNMAAHPSRQTLSNITTVIKFPFVYIRCY